MVSITADRQLPAALKRGLRLIGERTRDWRRLQGLTAVQVAERAHISRPTLRKIETGDGSVSLENYLRVARAIGILDLVVDAIDPLSSDVGRLRMRQAAMGRVDE